MLNEKLMEDLSEEISRTLQAMAKAKTAEEKLAYSQAVKNLCQSLDVFLQAAANFMAYADDGEDGPF